MEIINNTKIQNEMIKEVVKYNYTRIFLVPSILGGLFTVLFPLYFHFNNYFPDNIGLYMAIFFAISLPIAIPVNKIMTTKQYKSNKRLKIGSTYNYFFNDFLSIESLENRINEKIIYSSIFKVFEIKNLFLIYLKPFQLPYLVDKSNFKIGSSKSLGELLKGKVKKYKVFK